MSSADELVRFSAILKRQNHDSTVRSARRLEHDFGKAALGQGEQTQFLDRFIRQYRHDDGRTIIDLFVETHPELTEAARIPPRLA